MQGPAGAMFDAPIDTWYRWLGVGAASLAVLGVAVGLPGGPAPDAAAIAATVDRVAASPYVAVADRPVGATGIRLGPGVVTLRTAGRRSSATFAYTVTPVRSGTRLDAVLRGTPPPAVFESRRGFASAVERARDRTPTWRTAGDRLQVRRVTWEGTNATLVG